MKNLQKELLESANEIREKYRALKRGKFLEAEERFQTFQPLIEPLQELKNIAQDNKNSEQEIIPFKPQQLLAPKTPSRIPILNTTPSTPLKLDFGILASKYLSNYLRKNNITDSTYGLRREDDKFYIGNKEVEIANDDIVIDDKFYKGTKGLWELLTLKEPINYNDDDIKVYKEILELTSAHLKRYKLGAPLSSNKHSKYTNIIKPLFTSLGSGLREVTNNKMDYIYWDNPNELVDRLRLLYLSKLAGNTGVNNEIDSIIEELRESGIIY